MNKIRRKQKLADEVFLMEIEAPLIAEERKPGQFVILQLDSEFAERFPLTIAGSDSEAGTITIIFQSVGFSTHRLADMDEGDEIENLVGPLGTPTHIENFGHVVCVGGGIGVAPLHPIVKAMKQAGNRITTIIGARTANLVILEKEIAADSDRVILCTNDGSYGREALVTEPLKELCSEEPPPDLVVAIGPPIMMKFCSKTTEPFGIKTIVSLNTIMVDGTGMCGGCRVSVGEETKFVCVDGPEFDGHLVDWDNMIARLNAYRNHENTAHDGYHTCKLTQG